MLCYVIHCMDDGRISTKTFYTVSWRQQSGTSGTSLCSSRKQANMTSKHANLSKQLERCCVWSCVRAMDSERSNRKNRREMSPESWGARLPQKLLHRVFLQDRDLRNGIHSHTRRCSTTRDWQGRTSYVSRDFACQWWWWWWLWVWWCHLANQMFSKFKNWYIFKNDCLTSETNYMTWCATSLTEIRERVYFFPIPFSFGLFCTQISWGIYKKNDVSPAFSY